MSGLSYTDLVRAQTSSPPTYGEQGQLTNGPTATPNAPPPAPPAAGSQLPQLGPAPQPPGGTHTAATQNPVDIFNTNLMNLLSRGQAAGNTAPLANEQNRLGVQQINNSMAPAAQMGIDNLKPSDALNARQNAGQLYNPEIKNLTARMQAAAQNVANFTDAINAAKSFGDSYTKSVQPTPEEIQSVQDMMIAGYTPSTAVLDNVSKYIDWKAVAAGKAAAGSNSNDPTSYKEYALTTDNPTAAGYAAFLKNGTGGTGGTVTERLLTSQGNVISSAQSTLSKEQSGSQNHFANPNTYLDLAGQYIAKNGNANDFLVAVRPDKYLSPSDAAYVTSYVKQLASSTVPKAGTSIDDAIAVAAGSLTK